ncbi:ATP-binding protein [Candidatus Methanarcanum hacksteinii]|uniref:ATP-binding protein n=1 Tax=Candidatus Methanarcanum hacksteinii TaxID=2911857 RepID=UPI0037DD8886
MFRRKIAAALVEWKESGMCKKKAAVIKGLRQIGKTVTVKQFAHDNYENVVYIDFKKTVSARAAFDGDIEIDRITLRLTAILPDAKFIPGHTVIIFDEIQECARARFSIKSFVEDGRYDIIATGSLLGIRGYNRKDRDIPVGFEHTLHMFPMDFEEFLWAKGVQTQITDYVRNCFIEKKIVDEPIHSVMMDHFLEYVCVGGMPSIVNTFIEKNDLNAVRVEQRDLLEQYRDDFGKYLDENENEVTDVEMLGRINQVFDSIPSQLSKENKKFQYSIMSKNARNKTHSAAIQWLVDYGLINKSYNLSSLQLPLNGNRDESAFKIYVADTGLFISMLGRETHSKILLGDLQIYKGAVFENVISDILAKNGVKLYYYHRDSGLEVDFISVHSGKVCLIEVKSHTGNTKSAKTVLNDKGRYDVDICYKLGNYNVGLMNGIFTIPVYMAPLVAMELSDE